MNILVVTESSKSSTTAKEVAAAVEDLHGRASGLVIATSPLAAIRALATHDRGYDLVLIYGFAGREGEYFGHGVPEGWDLARIALEYRSSVVVWIYDKEDGLRYDDSESVVWKTNELHSYGCELKFPTTRPFYLLKRRDFTKGEDHDGPRDWEKIYKTILATKRAEEEKLMEERCKGLHQVTK